MRWPYASLLALPLVEDSFPPRLAAVCAKLHTFEKKRGRSQGVRMTITGSFVEWRCSLIRKRNGPSWRVGHFNQ
jgi:hypothetical protein